MRYPSVSGDMPECVTPESSIDNAPSDRDRLDWQFLRREIEICTLDFQDDVANDTTREEYAALFELEQDERVTLADPQIVQRQFGVGGIAQ
jgi:hypothetical protein